MINAWRVAPTHDELFLERYGRLLALSLNLTGHNRELAEDLVHDAFVQFTLMRPRLDSINNIDGYLYGMLRNMHLSHLRAARTKDNSLRLVDYDTVDLSLGAVTYLTDITARDELRAICRFACTRKETSKAGSVLILRFFQGYYPAEIALLIASPRKAVDDWIRIARREAKLWLRNSTPATQFGRACQLNFTPCHSTTEFVRDLRTAVFSSASGRCLTDSELEHLYRDDSASAPDCRTLAHIVCCVDCLDRVNEILGLAPLSGRFPTDMLGPDPKDGTGGSASGPPPSSTVQKMKRRAKAVFEHTPTELRVAVNGLVVGSHSLTSRTSEQTVNLSLAEQIEFIEIFGDRDVRLLYMPVDPPPEGPANQFAQLALSNRRSLEVDLTFCKPWPRLKTCYSDPSLEHAILHDHAAVPRREPAPTAFTRRDPAVNSGKRVRAMMDLFLSLARPGVLTAVLAVALIVSLVLFRSPAPPVFAAELLGRAIASEKAGLSPEVVLHRTVHLEERIHQTGKLTARSKIEMWASPALGVTARRVYDEKNKLIAGEWTEASGSRTVYSRSRTPQKALDPGAGIEALVTDGTLWRADLSASKFSSLIEVAAATVDAREMTFVISYEWTNLAETDSAPSMVRTSLTLSRPSLRATEQSFIVSIRGELLEYRFIETGFERLANSHVAPGIFEPDSDFLRPGLKPAVGPERLETPPPSAADFERLSPARLASIEMDALYRLHQAGSCMREPSNLSVTAAGGLVVETIVETEKRKTELQSRLNDLSASPAVSIQIYTVDEAARRQLELPRPAMIGGRIEIARHRVALHDDLSEYFSDQSADGTLTADRLEDLIRRFTTRVLAHSRLALIHAQTLKRHLSDLSRAELDNLGADEQAKRRMMIREHLAAFQSETRRLRLELEPVFFDKNVSDEPMGLDGLDRRQAIERLIEAAAEHERVMRSAFTLSSAGQSLRAKTVEFHRSLRYTESLAAVIEKEY